ncbi:MULTISPECIES: hypothetical protein [unclassified Streptomyces]|uniref:hypothetical protein n=1 Tax=unclassified Streptomyces TaxID=2593676 RepID=UPI000823E0EC|nr:MULTISPECIES: hypothetical protein [unclassified Streptomyces]MYT96642.1 hypothetical protein [Streptomyces sp. SID8350]SCK54411.1 hypothetical protein YUWDRAFT_04846 [Streptomyces sp. AmelKG-D3]
MLIEQYIVTVRRQFTGESLTGARRRLRELRDWSEPVPVATHSDQERLESHLLQALGAGRGRHPLGISEIVPFADRLVLRLESVELLTAMLPLLPYRDGRRSRHGVVDLRATAKRGGVELILGRSGSGRVLLVGPRSGCDLASVLVAHMAAVEARRHLPLWTEGTPHDPLPRPMRSSRPAQATSRTARGRREDVHAASPRLASAVLRRLHLWERLADDSTVTVTSEPQSEGCGLAWTVERLLPQGNDLHDENIAVVLADPVAGPGLTADLNGHRCDQKQCVQTFASGQLTVRTVRGELAPAARQRTRARVTSPLLRERHPADRTVTEGPGGHVLQLISPMGDDRELMDAAEQLAAAWAQQGLLTLVLRVDSWDRQNRKTSWRRSRLTGGSVAMFKGKADFVHGNLEADITKARADFDHIIVVKRQWVDVPSLGITPLADDHLVVANGRFPRTTRSTTAHAGKLQRHTTDLSPAESAVAWLHTRLARIPFADVPMTGLLLQCALEEHSTDSFDGMVDAELTRHGMPVLGRLPQPNRRSPLRTVLDHLPDDQRAFVMKQSAQIRRGLGPARADGTVLTAALRQLMEL